MIEISTQTCLDARAEIGVIGGSGFTALAGGHTLAPIQTPYGAPSGPITLSVLAGRKVAFIARHGEGHQFAPHLINYRANLWALRSLGVRQILAPCAVGSLTASLPPGTIAVPDQIVDRTSGRYSTIWDVVGTVIHVGFADPYCPNGRRAALDQPVLGAREGGTMVVISGPRFSTRAESGFLAANGWSLINMTGMPEAVLARELALCYTAIAVVTDYDVGREGVAPVSQAEVMRVFAANMGRLRAGIASVIAGLPPLEPDEEATCPCRRSLDDFDLPFALP